VLPLCFQWFVWITMSGNRIWMGLFYDWKCEYLFIVLTYFGWTAIFSVRELTLGKVCIVFYFIRTVAHSVLQLNTRKHLRESRVQTTPSGAHMLPVMFEGIRRTRHVSICITYVLNDGSPTRVSVASSQRAKGGRYPAWWRSRDVYRAYEHVWFLDINQTFHLVTHL